MAGCVDSSSPLSAEMSNGELGSIHLKTAFPFPGVWSYYARFTTEIKQILPGLLLLKRQPCVKHRSAEFSLTTSEKYSTRNIWRMVTLGAIGSERATGKSKHYATILLSLLDLCSYTNVVLRLQLSAL